MEILFVLVPLSVVLALLIGLVLWWAVRNDQFEDLDAAGARILLDVDCPEPVAGKPGEAMRPPARDGREGEAPGN